MFGDREEVRIKLLRLPLPQNKFKNLYLRVYTLTPMRGYEKLASDIERRQQKFILLMLLIVK
jgi:hypothetical protein